MAARALVMLCLLLAVSAGLADARKSSSRRLNDGYPKSGYSGGSSPVSSGSSPVSSGSSPSAPYTSPSSGSSPVVTPVSPTPVVSTPSSPVTIPPVTATPTGGYGGYGSRSGSGTSGFWGRNPGRVPRILSLLSTVVKIFGPRALKFFGNRNLLGAIKDVNSDPMASLAREGSASLINSYAYSDFPLSASDVISQFNSALDTPEAAAMQASKFQQFNEGV